MAAIDVRELSKTYGEVVGVESLSFVVEKGEIFGFLGPNGAGKTTTIRVLLGLLSPTAGSADVLDADVTDEADLIEAKRRIGYLPAELGFDEEVTGKRVLDYFASIRGDERREDLLTIFTPPLEREIREYSSGNRQMLGVIQAFMHDPDLVIMDEPTAGLDPLKQERFNEFVRAERDRGTTIFFSSHVLSEVRRVCDRVGILRDGHLVAAEDVESLIDRGGKRVRVQVAGDGSGLGDVEGATDARTVGDERRFAYTGDYGTLLAHLASYDIVDVEIAEPPLEDVFMHYYGGDRKDEHEGGRKDPREAAEPKTEAVGGDADA